MYNVHHTCIPHAYELFTRGSQAIAIGGIAWQTFTVMHVASIAGVVGGGLTWTNGISYSQVFAVHGIIVFVNSLDHLTSVAVQ